MLVADGEGATPWLETADDMTLLYVLTGSASLELGGGRCDELRRGSAATLGRGERFRLTTPGDPLLLLDVAVSPR